MNRPKLYNESVILTAFVLVVIFVAVAIRVSHPPSKDQFKPITVEKFKNIRPGDFIRTNGYWYSVAIKNGDLITVNHAPDRPSIENIDSVIFAPRDMDSNRWQKMALEYLATH